MGRIAALLDLQDEGGELSVLAPQDVLDEKGASRDEHAADLTYRRQELGKVMRGDATGDHAEGGVPEGQGLDIGGHEAHTRGAALVDESARSVEHGLGDVGGDHARGEAGEAQGRVASPRGDVEHAVGAARAAPGEQAVEVGAAGMARARDVVLRRSSELRLDVRLVRLGHALAGPGGRSAR